MMVTLRPAMVKVDGKLVLYRYQPASLITNTNPRTGDYNWRKCPKLNWTMTADGYVCDAREQCA